MILVMVLVLLEEKCFLTLGFEAYDPTNMYQYSAYAYDIIGGQDIYDAYDVGASIDYVYRCILA